MSPRLIVVLISTGLTSFLSTYLAAAVNLALKPIGTELGATPTELSLLASVYLLLTSLCLIPFGRLSDRYGPKQTLMFGCGFFILSNLAVPLLANDFATLVALRGLQGVGAALLLVSNTPIVIAVFPKEYRVTALGVLSGMVFFGYSVGSYLGGLLTEHFGWRSVFLGAAAGGTLALAGLWLLVPRLERRPPAARGPVDLPGLLFYAVTLIALQAGAAQLVSPLGPGLLVVSALALALFIRRQGRAPNPIYDIGLFRTNRVFARANLAVLLTFTASYGSYYLLPLYLQCNRGLSPAEAGEIALLQPLMQIVASPIAGFLADRTQPARIAATGMAVLAVALGLLSQLSQDTPFLMIETALVLTGLGISLFSAPNTSMIVGSVAEERRGAAAASNAIMRNLGMQLSIVVCGSAFLLALGTTGGLSPDQYPGMLAATRICYALFAGLCLVGAAVSLLRAASPGQTYDKPKA
jgi:MFS family permease